MADELDPNERGMLEHWRPMDPPADFVDRLVAARFVRRRLVPAALAGSLVVCAAIVIMIMRPRSDKHEVVAVASADAALPSIEIVAAADAGVFVIDAHINVLPSPLTLTKDIDRVLPAGERATIHDPRGETTIRMSFDAKCPDRGIVAYDKEPNFFRSPRTATGSGSADLRLAVGAWSYRVTCDGSPVIVAKGGVIVMKDSGKRPLPKSPAMNRVDVDGRTYRISYQGDIPTVEFNLHRPGTLHLASPGREDTFESIGTKVKVPGYKLREGTYTYWSDDPPMRRSTLIIDFDQTAPQVYIESPGGNNWPDEVDLRGAVLPGWKVSFESVDLPINAGRFAAKVSRPLRALVLRATHPQRGIHYYLRRP